MIATIVNKNKEDNKMIEEIKTKLNSVKIREMQLDPNGLCNVGCWYCPVRYRGNPTHTKNNMPKELLRKILKNIFDEKHNPDGLIHSDFYGFYTAHYNEVLLYKHFDYMLELCREFNFCTGVLSNGTTLTKQRIDLIKQYPDVVNVINLNIPIFSDAELWAKRVNSRPELHEKLLNNIRYAMDQLPEMVENNTFNVVTHGIAHPSLLKNGGWIETGENFPSDIDLDVIDGEHAKEIEFVQKLFPNLQVSPNLHLIDRAGLLSGVIDNSKAVKNNLMNNDENSIVIGCTNGHDTGGRPFGWLHVNSSGEAFLCCNDFDMETTFGDFKSQNLNDFWLTDKHAEIIDYSYKTICKGCNAAQFKTK